MSTTIAGVYTLTATDTAVEIPLPQLLRTSDKVQYIFDGSHSASFELVQTSTDTEGVPVAATTRYETRDFSLVAPPKWLYRAAGGVPVRVTVVAVR